MSFRRGDRVVFRARTRAAKKGYGGITEGMKGTYIEPNVRAGDEGAIGKVKFDIQHDGDTPLLTYLDDLQPDTKPQVHIGNELMNWKWGPVRTT